MKTDQIQWKPFIVSNPHETKFDVIQRKTTKCIGRNQKILPQKYNKLRLMNYKKPKSVEKIN